jgi:DNA polymerase (family 10)
MNLARAKKLAARIVAELEPFCDRIEIAGSIRRERPEVNDIDLVLIPKPGAKDKILNRCAHKLHIVTGGRRPDLSNVTFVSGSAAPFQLDLFFAHDEIIDLVSTKPTNWGAVLLCRTGSMQHNIQLCNYAITRGLKFAPYRGVIDRNNEIIASATEEEIYGALGLVWRHPRDREVLNI